MRKPAEVLELALTLLDEYKGSYFMCCMIEHLELDDLITWDEGDAVRQVVRRSIDYRVTLCGYLHSRGELPPKMISSDEEFRPYQVKFYTDLINKLKQEENQ